MKRKKCRFFSPLFCYGQYLTSKKQGIRNRVITDNHYSKVEVEELLECLGDAVLARILKNYNTLGCESRTGLSDRDVLHNVISQALLGERAWKKGLSATSYLTQSGRSVISNEAAKRSKQVILPNIDDLMTNEDGDLSPSSTVAKLAHPPPEAILEVKQTSNIITEWIDKVRLLFEDDKDASCFIEQRIATQKKSKILIFCEFTDQIYRNVEKRIKDKVSKRFPNGFPWWDIES